MSTDPAVLKAENEQLRFLLAIAPMLDAPTEDRLAASRVEFAYIHPKTFAGYHRNYDRYFVIIPGSPTKWVLTSLMPEGRVIYSPLALPYLSSLLAK